MNNFRIGFFTSVVLVALTGSLPSAAWGAVELEDLPFMRPSEGTAVDLPLSDQASAIGVVTATRTSKSAPGTVLYGELTGDVAGSFMIWVGGRKVESFVDIDSAPLDVLLSVPEEGYRTTRSAGSVVVTAEAFVASDEDLECDLTEPDPPEKALPMRKSGVQGIIGDQGGAPYPSSHVFYDLLDYAASSLEVPKLNSFSYSGNKNQDNTPRAVIYLDFNGGQVARGPVIYSAPAFVSSSSYVLDSGDVARIEDAFQVVAERLRPFDINVTTDLAEYLSTPPGRRSWAFCTADTSGGSAPLSGFGGDNPALVGCGSGISGLKAGRIASHEIGHLLNVHHFGPGFAASHPPYYDGHPSYPGSLYRWNTPTGWSSVSKVYQWTQGEYYGATYGGNGTGPAGPPIVPPNYIDSLALIDTELGAIGYRADDRPNSRAAAKTLVDNAEFNGVIETNTDKDFFKFTTYSQGAIVIDLLSLADHPELAQIDGNTGRSMAALDVHATLQDASGATIATSNPVDSLDALIDLPAMPAGTYYLRVKGTGVGTPTASAPTGYTRYGSLGSYSVLAAYESQPSAWPDLTVTSFSFSATNDTGDGLWWWQVNPVATVENQGAAPAPGSMVKALLAHDAGSPEPMDVVFNHHDVLEPGEQAVVQMYFPIDLTWLAGDYRLGAKVDANDEVDEYIYEANNLLMDDDVTNVDPVCPITPPTARALPGAPGEGIFITSGQTVTLGTQTSDPQGDPILYHWDFDNDGIADAISGPTPSGQESTIDHTFYISPTRRVYYVRVRAQAGPDVSPWSYLPSKSLVVAVDP